MTRAVESFILSILCVAKHHPQQTLLVTFYDYFLTKNITFFLYVYPLHRIKSVPPLLLSGASSLCTLTLSQCPITMEMLRETSGFHEFEVRRKRKYDKIVGLQVLSKSGGFNQGADVLEWEKWK